MNLETTVETTIYESYYKKFQEDKDGKIAKKHAMLFKTLAYGIGSLTIGSTLLADYQSLKDVIWESAFIVSGVALTVHFHELRKISESIHKRKAGRAINQMDIDELKKKEMIGVTAHRIGAALIYGIMGYIAIEVNEIIGAVVVGLEYYVYRTNIWQGYKGIYAGYIDSAIGTRRNL